jgi:hypothetical protein
MSARFSVTRTANQLLTCYNTDQAYQETLRPTNEIDELGKRQLGHTPYNVAKDPSESSQGMFIEIRSNIRKQSKVCLLLKRQNEGDEDDAAHFALAHLSHAR